VISGRSLRDLAAMSRLPMEVQLVGSHGSEFTSDADAALPSELSERLTRLRADTAAVAGENPGVRIEQKPAGLAVHVRGVEPDVRQRTLDAVRAMADRLEVYA